MAIFYYALKLYVDAGVINRLCVNQLGIIFLEWTVYKMCGLFFTGLWKKCELL